MNVSLFGHTIDKYKTKDTYKCKNQTQKTERKKHIQ